MNEDSLLEMVGVAVAWVPLTKRKNPCREISNLKLHGSFPCVAPPIAKHRKCN